MNALRAAGTILVVGTVALGAAEAYAARDWLPERVASHFGFDGRADGWMSRDAFLAAAVGLLAFVAALFLALAYGVRWLPTSLINLPHREYWLADDRRAASIEAISKMLLGFGVLTTTFVYGILKLTLVANEDEHPRFGNGVWSIAVGFAVCIVAIIAATLVRFRMPTSSERSR